ncbi:MAG: serine/threonine-protein kinase, partial [Lentisphaerae bacterium]|nr:serine/threonine-protein kinase [Lentisphaerota bacterium]
MKFQCPFCRNVLEVENSDCGTEVGCPKCEEVSIAPQSPVSAGVVVGNDFLIVEEIGRGGMGVVYLTHQMSLDRRAALKILSKKYASNSEFVAGFIKEARAAAKLNHPHIVQAYAVGEDSGIYFFAMEYIDGETMKSVLKREGCIPVETALTIIQQIAEALDYAWKEQRLIHRDIKPDNIMITKNGRAKLADLGLARIAGEIEDKDDDEIMGT